MGTDGTDLVFRETLTLSPSHSHLVLGVEAEGEAHGVGGDAVGDDGGRRKTCRSERKLESLSVSVSLRPCILYYEALNPSLRGLEPFTEALKWLLLFYTCYSPM